MHDHPVKAVISAADRAINDENLDALMDFYTDDAVLVVTPEKLVTGKAQIRKAFDAIAAHFNHTVRVSQGEMRILEGGDTVLVLSNTRVEATAADGTGQVFDRQATYVFRLGADGRWRCAIDNSYGTALLARPS